MMFFNFFVSLHYEKLSFLIQKIEITSTITIDKDGGVLFLVEKDEVKIKGIPAGQVEHLAGCLKKYAPSYVPLSQVREKIRD